MLPPRGLIIIITIITVIMIMIALLAGEDLAVGFARRPHHDPIYI